MSNYLVDFNNRGFSELLEIYISKFEEFYILIYNYNVIGVEVLLIRPTIPLYVLEPSHFVRAVPLTCTSLYSMYENTASHLASSQRSLTASIVISQSCVIASSPESFSASRVIHKFRAFSPQRCSRILRITGCGSSVYIGIR